LLSVDWGNADILFFVEGDRKMETVRPKADASLGWAFRPDEDTVSALAQGVKKIRRHPGLGSDRPHYGGNLAEALAKEREKGKRNITRKRRRTMAKKVHRLKEIAARKSGSVKKTVQAAAPSKKKTVQEASSDGKMIPLKKLCEQLDLDPKATRVKLRRMIAKGDIEFHDHSQRWEFTPAQAKVVRAALTA
jgi:hypothetical protein